MDDRQGTFNLVELGLIESQAKIEAMRCLKCDLNINVETNECVLCGRCSMVCPVGALKQVDVTDEEQSVSALREQRWYCNKIYRLFVFGVEIVRIVL